MRRAILLWLSAVLALHGCGRRELAPVSPLDTAATHYGRGLLALDEGDLRTAQTEFERARSLDGEYPGAPVGAALVASAQGDFFGGRKLIEQALHRDRDFADAHVALGRIIAAEGVARQRDRDSWLSEARRSFERAARLDGDRPEPAYYQAQAELAAGELDAATASLSRVVAMNRGPLVAKAMAQIERIQDAQRASPGTRIGMRIATEPRLTRAELAVLLLEELRLEDLIRQRRAAPPADAFRPPAIVPAGAASGETLDRELGVSWARPWIERVLALAVPGLERLPDGSFRPDEPVTRAQLARVVEGILVLLEGDPALATRYVGEASRFADVRGDHYAYNAIALSVDRGIIAPDRVSGTFRPESPVAGAEALVIVRELQNAVRMEF